MPSSLMSLKQSARPPEVPAEAGRPEDWPRVERELGTALPDDYKAFVNLFGTGAFRGFLRVFNPFAADAGVNLLARARQAGFGGGAAVGTGGLLPWGETTAGDALCWKVEDPPDRWPVVVREARTGALHRFDKPVTTFLFQWLSGVIAADMLPVPETNPNEVRIPNVERRHPRGDNVFEPLTS